MDDNVVARLVEVGKAWTPPPPLEQAPDSWKNWPVPSSMHLYTGEDLARNKSAHCMSDGKVTPAPALVDGEPRTAVEVSGPNAWWEVDLGKSYPLAGLHLWNRATLNTATPAKGHILVSEQPFESNDPEQMRHQGGVKVIAITEPPGYPTAYAINATGRFIRIVSNRGQESALGEVEVFAQTNPNH
jgi:hypothetical protein